MNANQVGIEGVSRYGKAALVTMAFDTRFAVALIGSSGEGGAKLYLRNWGEAVENLKIFPRNDNLAVMPEIDRINANLAGMADGRKIRYLNINGQLAERDGKLRDGMMNERDKLHPALNGYQVWADALKPFFTELLGPPASEDHAPPPTGDPSVRR